MTKRTPAGAEAPDDRALRRQVRRRRLRRVGLAALCVVCVVVALWEARKTIATSVVDRTLAQAHVRARYRIVDLGLGRQRLVDVVIGDPARPDLSADWVELRTRIGLDGAQVTALGAGGLRVRASLADGRLSFGAIDRLLPTTTGGGFRFPAIDLDVADARVRVGSAAGVVDVALSGRGRLDGGFRGRVTAMSDGLVADGCTARRPSLAAAIGIDRGAVTLVGPLSAERVVCGGADVARPVVGLTATLADGLTRWNGRAAVRADRVAASPLVVRAVSGRITFAGSRDTTTGAVSLTGRPARVDDIASRSVALSGRYRIGGDPAFAGRVRAAGVSLPATMLAAIRRQERSATATPVAPLLAHAAAAMARAASDFDVAADVGVARGGVSLTRLEGVARSGASASFIPAGRTRIAANMVPRVAGTARLSGGGLPTATVRLAQTASGRPIAGVATVAPYSAGDARMMLDPVRLTVSPDGVHIVTVATLSGPLPGGRVERLRLPVTADWNGAGALAVNPGCTALSFDRLAISTLRLQAARLPMCATGSALIRVANGKVEGGGRIPSLLLAGRLGSAPLTLAAEDTRFAIGSRSVGARNVTASLGETQLDIGHLFGTPSADGIGGGFEGAGGRIGKVPLLLSAGNGDWRFAHGALTLAGDAIVADAGTIARFKPLRADAIRLRLAASAIDATARLVAPERAIAVADVTIAHDLGSGTGAATLAVPRLAFTEAFQPDALTPLTFGVVADVRGTVVGDARIGWSPTGVTSTGTFRTDGLDLAAAFGPVGGIAGTLRFTDLLALESAPDQLATVASINPGVPVTDGQIVYRLLPGSRMQVTSGRWPFAGGSLDLRPTTLDFGGSRERRLTFALDGVDAGRFLQQFDFGNLSATGTFDGTLPMIFGADGGRIAGGRLQVRRGGNIAYLGELTQKDLGLWGNVAFQALRSIDYRDLAIAMDGPLAGEIITEVRFAGVSQGKGARSNVLIRRLQKLPFVFNIRIRAPFRGLIDSAQSFYDPSRLVTRNLPALMQEQDRVSTPSAEGPSVAIQPAERDRPR